MLAISSFKSRASAGLAIFGFIAAITAASGAFAAGTHSGGHGQLWRSASPEKRRRFPGPSR